MADIKAGKLKPPVDPREEKDKKFLEKEGEKKKKMLEAMAAQREG